MEYNYPHERAENRSNQESGQGHPSNQHLLHYQHQQYPPTHHAIQAGYPGLRLAPYMNPLQSAGPSTGLVHNPEAGLVQPPRVPTSASAGSSSRESSQGGHEFENVLTNVMQGSSVPSHYQQEPTPPHSQHGMPMQQILSSQQSPPIQPGQVPSGSEAYHIEDLSHATQTSRMVTSTGGALNTSIGAAKSSSRVVSSTGRTPKKRAAPASSPKQPSKQASTGAPSIVTPQVYQQPQQLQRSRERISFSKHCQTDPLFQQIYKASAQFAKDGDLPEGLKLVEDEKEEKISGVVATKDLEVGMEFGPFTGEFVKEGLGCFNPSTWEICVLGRTWYYIDGSKDPNNWMHHVQYARNTDEQNMEAYQVYGDIFFRLTKPVKAGTELRVFYSQEYCKHVGFKAHLDDLLYFIEAQRFECRDCDNRYTNSKSLFRHIKFEHNKEDNVIPPAEMEPVLKKDPPKKPKIPNLMTIKDVAAKLARDKAMNAEKNKVRGRTKVDKSKFLKVKLVPIGKSRPVELEDSFACKKCNKTFPTDGRLKQHAAFHKEMKGVRPLCDVCGLECKNSLALKQHQLSHNPEALQCEMCKKFFRRKGCLRYHMRHVHQKSLGEKWTRGKVQEQMPRYVGPGEEEDDEEFHPELPKDMLDSDQGSATEEEDDEEEEDENGPDDGDDDDDVHDGDDDDDLNDDDDDQDDKNDDEEEPDVDNDEKIPEKPQVKTRKKKQDNTAQKIGNPDLVCKICGEEQKNKKILQQHQLSHDPEAFQCQYCGWYFKRKACMVFHLRTKHNVSMGKKWLRGTIEERIEKGSKPEAFPGESILEEELRKQRREQRLIKDPKGLRKKCNKCGKVCQNFNLWRQHMMSHNPNSLQCQECKWYFSRKSSLIYHLRSKHHIYVGEKYSRIRKEELMLQDKHQQQKEEDGISEEDEEDEEDDDDDERMQEENDERQEDEDEGLQEDEDDGMQEKDQETDKRESDQEDDREETPNDKPRAVDKKKVSNGADNFCNICGLECENKRMLSQHMISHDAKALQCRFCKWFFRRSSCLAFHLRHRHQVNIGKKWTKGVRKELMKYAIRAKDRRAALQPPKPEDVPDPEENDDMDDYDVAALVYQCNFCPKKFSSGDFQLTHEMIVHVNPTRYRCPICHKAFQSRYALESHSQIHKQPNTFECGICNKKFNSNDSLVKHMLYHDVMDNSELVNVTRNAKSTTIAVEPLTRH